MKKFRQLRNCDYQALYFARTFADYDTLQRFARFYGGSVPSRKRFNDAKHKIKIRRNEQTEKIISL